MTINIEEISAAIPLVRAESPNELLSLQACRDLLASIRGTAQYGDLAEDTVWHVHAANGQKPLSDAASSRDAEKLHAALAALHRNFIMEGFDQHGRHTEILDGCRQQQAFNARIAYKALLQCAIGLGVERAFNPEQPGDYPCLTENATDALVQNIRSALAYEADFPRTAEGAWGLGTSFGLLTHRQVLSLGYLREFLQHLQITGRRYDRIVEIGGGIGRAAYNIAVRKSHPYAIIDIPMVGIVQYAFLTANGVSCSLWPERLSNRPGHVDIVSAFDLSPLEGVKRALFMNFDGMVEMSGDTIENYFSLVSMTGSDFLSVNHESDRVMIGTTRHNWNLKGVFGRSLSPMPRRHFWERPGYIAQSYLAAR